MRGNIQNSSQCRDWGPFFSQFRGWEGDSFTQSQNKKSTNHSDKNKNKIS